jgi:phosphatidylinositol transfer protein SFH5
VSSTNTDIKLHFSPLSYGKSLAGELSAFGQQLPVAYGGEGKDVKDGLTVKYTTVEASKPSESEVAA